MNYFSSQQGDSGGPILINGVQVGIVSYGSTDCGASGTANAFTRVASFMSWIEVQMSGPVPTVTQNPIKNSIDIATNLFSYYLSSFIG